MTFRSGPVTEELSGMNSTQREATRELFKSDLWFAANGVLGYDQLYEPLHGPLCNFLVHCDATRRLVLMPRGFLKSTVCTISNPIRKACADPEGYRACIENENLLKATSFLDEIKSHWMYNSALRLLFPELVPIKFAGPGSDWAVDHASLNAARISKESTWTCIGAGGTGTGFHFNHIIPDDLIGEQHKLSQADMNRVKVWNRSQDQLCDSPELDTIDWIGTRKTVDDVYNDVIERETDLVIFHVEPFDDNGESVFPKISTEWLKKKRDKDPSEWAHDYMNNPVGSGGMDWGRNVHQDFFFEGSNVVFTDPVTKKLKRWSVSSLDRVLTADPNSGQPMAPDKAAVVVHGVSPHGEVFVLKSRSGRPSPSEFVDWIYEDANAWAVRAVGIEEAGQQNTAYYFEQKCLKLRGRYWTPIPLKPKNEQKDVRIRKSLDPLFKQRRIFTQPTQYTLRSQIEFHPQLAQHNWDEIDCLSYGPRLYQNGVSEADLEVRDAVRDRILSARGRTGYGNGKPLPQQTRTPKTNYELLFGKVKMRVVRK